jgi:hypothetical protein
MSVTIEYNGQTATLAEGSWKCAGDRDLEEFLNDAPGSLVRQYLGYTYSPDREMSRAEAICAEAKDLNRKARIVSFSPRKKVKLDPNVIY